MSEYPADIVARIEVARALAEHLVRHCKGFESDEWMEKFDLVRDLLNTGRIKDALREESRLSTSQQPKWVVSRELTKRLERAMNNLFRQMNHQQCPASADLLEQLPTDVAVAGTIAEEQSRNLSQIRFFVDPQERDPAFNKLLDEAKEMARAELSQHPLADQPEFYHVVWERTKLILYRDHRIKWKSPREMNPHILFD